MQHFRSYQALYLAFTSKELYRDVLTRWPGFGFTHLLLLNMLIVTPAVLYIAYGTHAMLFSNGKPSPFALGIVNEISAQVPELRFEGGELSTQIEQPYAIKVHLEDSEHTLAVIDLDANIGLFQTVETSILLTKDAVHIRKDNGQILTRLWSEFENENSPPVFVLDAESAHQYGHEGLQWMSENKWWLSVTFFLVGWCGTLLVMLLYRIAQALIFGGAVILFAGMNKLTINFQEAVRLSCVAITPPILIDALMAALLGEGISIELFLLLTLGYCFLAVKSNKESA